MSFLEQEEVYSKGQSLTNQNQIDCPLPSQVTTTQYFIDFVFLFLCCNTRLPPFHHIWLIYLFCLWSCTEASDSMMETLRAKETYCFHCQGCMTRLLEDRWGADGTRRSISANGFLLPPSSTGRGAGVYWWCDPAVERKIDGWSWSPQLSTTGLEL